MSGRGEFIPARDFGMMPPDPTPEHEPSVCDNCNLWCNPHEDPEGLCTRGWLVAHSPEELMDWMRFPDDTCEFWQEEE